jgi:hypothetical protein
MHNKVNTLNKLDLDDYNNMIDIRKKIFFDEINSKNNHTFFSQREIPHIINFKNKDIQKRRHSLFKFNSKNENKVFTKRNSFLAPDMLDNKSRNLTKLFAIIPNDNKNNNCDLPLIKNNDNHLTDNNRKMNSYLTKTIGIKFKSSNNLQNIMLIQEKENEYEQNKLNTTSKNISSENILNKKTSKSNKLLLKVK